MCAGGVWTVANQDVAVPTGTTQVQTSISVVGGNFSQPQGSTLVFTAPSGGGSSAAPVAISGGGCGVLQGNAVVQFETEVGAQSASAALLQGECIEGQFGSVTGQATGGNCESYGDGAQSVSGSTLSAAFEVDRSGCGGGSGGGGGLSTGAIAGIAVGGAVLFAGAVAAAVVISRKRLAAKVNKRAHQVGMEQTEFELGRMRQ